VLARRGSFGALPDYGGIGRNLREQARFSYLYPAEWMKSSWEPWLPYYEQERGLVWKRQDGGDPLPYGHFRQRLLATHPGTAIDPASDIAAEGTLHEFEYVLPRWRHNGAPVAFVGYVFVREGSCFQETLRDVGELWIGGEGRYGFGRLRQATELKDDMSDCFGVRLDLNREDPIVQNSSFVWAHALPRPDSIKAGAWEVVLGWDRGSLFSVALEGPCWAPGSRSVETASFRILDSGFWEQVTP